MPMIGRARLLRVGGIMDMSMDGYRLLIKLISMVYILMVAGVMVVLTTPASGYCYAHLLAKDEPHPVARDFKLDRFIKGKIIDEKGQVSIKLH